MAIDGSMTAFLGGQAAGWAQRWAAPLDASSGAQASGGAGTDSSGANLSSLAVTVSVSSASVASGSGVYGAPRGFGHAHSWKALASNTFDTEARLRVLMLERMTGHALPVELADALQNAAHAGATDQSPAHTVGVPGANNGALPAADAGALPGGVADVPGADDGVAGSQSLTVAAQETAITATGELQTADGKKIDFALSLDVSAAVATETETGQAANGAVGQDGSGATEVAVAFSSMSFSLEMQESDGTGTMMPDAAGSAVAVPNGESAAVPNGAAAVESSGDVTAGSNADSATLAAPGGGSMLAEALRGADDMSSLLDGLARYLQQALSPQGADASSSAPQPLNVSA